MFLIPSSLHGRNRITRQQRHDRFWQAKKKQFSIIMSVMVVCLWLLILGNMAYLYGSIWKSEDRIHNFRVLYVDFDEGVIGSSVSQAYDQLKGPSFPTFVARNRSQYPTTDDVVDAVKDTSYWAAFVVAPNASTRLTAALQGGPAAETYQPSAALTYIWNEIRYTPFEDDFVQSNFLSIIDAARLAFNSIGAPSAIKGMNTSDTTAFEVLLDPIQATDINLMPTTQGTKLFYGTVSQVMVILQQFFFLLILNGLSGEVKLYSKLPLHISGLIRAGLCIVYVFGASLCTTGYIWGYRESWPVNGAQFPLTWMTFWLLMHIHLLVLDCCTAFLPLPAQPFFVLTWIIINICSSISPFELNPGFYKWSYALPTNEAYTVLTDIWSFGSVPQLDRALPVLFSWWIVMLPLATIGHLYRCHRAWKEDAEVEKLLNSEGQSVDVTAEVLMEAARMHRENSGPSTPLPAALWSTAKKHGLTIPLHQQHSKCGDPKASE